MPADQALTPGHFVAASNAVNNVLTAAGANDVGNHAKEPSITRAFVIASWITQQLGLLGEFR